MSSCKTPVLISSAAIALACASGASYAQTISELEPNDSIATAQSITGGGVTINGTGDGTFDYFSFGIGALTIDGVAVQTSGSFETTAGNFDTELFLYDSAGNLVAQDDDGGAGLLSLITQDFGSPGTYAIGVGEFNSAGSPGGIIGNAPDAGDTYTLQVELSGDTIATAHDLNAALGDSSATIVADGAGSFDYYGFDVFVSNATIDGVAAVTSGSFETTAGNFDTELFLYDSAGNLVAQDDDGGAGLLSQITQDFGSSGSFAIGVGEFNSVGSPGGITGNAPDAGDTYTLQVALTDGNSIDGAFNVDTALLDGEALVAASGDGTFDYYSFTAMAGDTFRFGFDDANFDTELFLYDLAGSLLAQDDDGGLGLLSQIDFTFALPGVYAIGVGEFNSAGSPGGIIGNAPDAGDSYLLRISLIQVATPVPEPAAFALFGFGLTALGFAAHRRRTRGIRS